MSTEGQRAMVNLTHYHRSIRQLTAFGSIVTLALNRFILISVAVLYVVIRGIENGSRIALSSCTRINED